MPDSIAAFDRSASLAINGLSGRGAADLAAIIFTWLGNAGFAFFFAALAVLLIRGRISRGVILVLVLALALGGSMAAVFKHSVVRDRPAADSVIGRSINDLSWGLKRSSFPSGHSVTAFGAATVVAAECGPVAGAVAFAVALLVGLSRIYLGAHFPSDVAAGALIGVVTALLVIYIARGLKPRPGGKDG